MKISKPSAVNLWVHGRGLMSSRKRAYGFTAVNLLSIFVELLKYSFLFIKVTLSLFCFQNQTVECFAQAEIFFF